MAGCNKPQPLWGGKARWSSGPLPLNPALWEEGQSARRAERQCLTLKRLLWSSLNCETTDVMKAPDLSGVPVWRLSGEGLDLHSMGVLRLRDKRQESYSRKKVSITSQNDRG